MVSRLKVDQIETTNVDNGLDITANNITVTNLTVSDSFTFAVQSGNTSVQPSSANTGAMFYNTDNGGLAIYDNGWKKVNGVDVGEITYVGTTAYFMGEYENTQGAYTTGIIINNPTGAQAGDFAVVAHQRDVDPQSDFVDPAGWTVIGDSAGSTVGYARLYAKVLTQEDLTANSYAFGGDTADESATVFSVYRTDFKITSFNYQSFIGDQNAAPSGVNQTMLGSAINNTKTFFSWATINGRGAGTPPDIIPQLPGWSFSNSTALFDGATDLGKAYTAPRWGHAIYSPGDVPLDHQVQWTGTDTGQSTAIGSYFELMGI